MKNFLKILLCLGLFFANCAKANLYKVENVSVVAERASAMEAKEAALAEGQVEAFRQLMTRLAPENLLEIPQINEETVLPYVLGVSIEDEKNTATKYMGHIAVEFNPKRVQELFNTQKVTYLKTQAPSLLVIPEYIVNGQTLVLDQNNPLYRSLKTKQNFAPFFQAVVPEGTAEEVASLSSGTGNVLEWLEKYQKEKVMWLRLVHEGNDLWQISTDFYPLNGMDNQRFVKRFRFSAGNPEQAAGEMADAMFKEMELRWRNDRTTSMHDDRVLYLRVEVRSLQEWLLLEKEMKSWSCWDKFALKGVYLPQVLVEVSYKGDIEDVEERLLNLGWKLDRDFSGNGGNLTRISAYE